MPMIGILNHCYIFLEARQSVDLTPALLRFVGAKTNITFLLKKWSETDPVNYTSGDIHSIQW